MKHYGLIGKSLEHSFSKNYFTRFFNKNKIDAGYKNFELENLDSIRELVSDQQLRGFNVTIPYKQEIIKHLDKISNDAAAINAVNAVLIKDKNLIGFNTDYIGFSNSISAHLSKKMKVLILGSGGASKAIKYALRLYNIEYTVVSSSGNGNIGYEQVDGALINKCGLIINCSPIGMFPKIDKMPNIDLSLIGKSHICYDLIYNPEETLFLKTARLNGAKTINGLPMLHIQADKAWDIWRAANH